MRVRIVSNGTGKPGSTKVIDVRNYRAIEGVVAVEWKHVAGRPPEAKIHVVSDPMLFVDADAEFVEADVSTLDDSSRKWRLSPVHRTDVTPDARFQSVVVPVHPLFDPQGQGGAIFFGPEDP